VDIAVVLLPCPQKGDDCSGEATVQRQVANAQLIACAPELLEACQALERELSAWHQWQMQQNPRYPGSSGDAAVCAVLAKGRAAIARAEGKAQ
jgi:hypothetical protein